MYLAYDTGLSHPQHSSKPVRLCKLQSTSPDGSTKRDAHEPATHQNRVCWHLTPKTPSSTHMPMRLCRHLPIDSPSTPHRLPLMIDRTRKKYTRTQAWHTRHTRHICHVDYPNGHPCQIPQGYFNALRHATGGRIRRKGLLHQHGRRVRQDC